ncbi:BBT_HP_G0013350.mRNA.1.CDS.1 [Saccharomyces cerevisiae]|nr:BBT_HP_G0037150.mRNA.1.CDS.1 [Saccharomyces cerevisiae]CAI4996869.1 BBT_HP_G0077230.mRNA.1.CDS.1 [Saccharomyces cerevisiae]CAI5207767.1 BBT_HP_G0013350.mRNA.1.CDS.1 [Saccharomyces cerevisiae]CAI6527912.1 BBT_HP_G0037150.mRNA.1.CDS.1 [Saccharomyces cerevisiae]CAI6884114.1 BBT_HP_G0077230.mRNA.1.CDS.1 [Saccharomyces cerevisiae]
MNDDSQDKIIHDIRIQLRKAATELSRWKLYGSSKWAAEALAGLAEAIDVDQTHSLADESPLRNKQGVPKQMFEIPQNGFGLSETEYDLYLLGSTLFDAKEFDRCVFFLKDVTNPYLKFLKLYSKFLSWDKKSQESMENILTTGKFTDEMYRANKDGDGSGNEDINQSGHQRANLKMVSNEHESQLNISSILKEINTFLESYEIKIDDDEADLGLALLYYLRGVILKQEKNISKAMSSFLKSLSCYSFNWSCWLELMDCLQKVDDALLLNNYLYQNFQFKFSENLGSQRTIEFNIMIKFFKLKVFEELNGQLEDYFEDLEFLLQVFPNFTFLKAYNATISYNNLDYVTAESRFDDIVKQDPYRLNDLETYSNILYVMQKNSKLAYLAQFVSQIDRFRPETCCIIANYYSARQEHEKSIMYFRRALTLDKKTTNAWTLMGHEFVELSNSHAAIECYRRAVDICPRDFKAWFGLGQAYALLDMHLYSLYYFQKACTLKPWDRRIWQVLGECYSKTGNKVEAIKCYKRSIKASQTVDQNTSIYYRLAQLYEELEDLQECKKFMMKCVDVEELLEGIVTDETVKARLWLAIFEIKAGNYQLAYDYAMGVSSGTSQEIEEARMLARECRRHM